MKLESFFEIFQILHFCFFLLLFFNPLQRFDSFDYPNFIFLWCSSSESKLTSFDPLIQIPHQFASDMVTICEQCGDEGFTNAFIYCVKCLGFVIHRYCLDVLPKTFDEFVYWVCEGCKPKSSYQLADSSVKANLKKRKKRHTACLVDETEEGSGNMVIRESDNEHVQLVDSPIKLDFKRKKTGNITSILERTEENSCSDTIGELDHECVAFPLAPFKMRLSIVDEADEDSCHKLSTELEHECVPLAELCIRKKIRKEKKKKKRCSETLAYSQVKKRLKKTIKENETGLFDVKEKSNSQLVINKENNTTCFRSETRDDIFQRSPNGHVDAQPVNDTIWTGSFDITNKDYETYAVGHVSSKVGSKVFEEASLLPSSLSLEMLPKSDLWPKSFLKNKPSDDNIALYFFPAAPEHETIFDILLKDVMNEELAMRAVLTNTELLIFSSEELPQKFWRVRDKFYLWGVFRRKRVNSSPQANNYLLNSKGSDRCDPHTNSFKKMENGKRTPRDSQGSERSDPRTNSSNKVESGTGSIHHEDARKNDCNVQELEATVKDGHTHVDSSSDADNSNVEPFINANNALVESSNNADNALVESSTNALVGSSINADNALVESFTNALVESSINADNALVESSTHALVESSINALVESSINADDNALVESFIHADHTQDDDLTENAENQETGSTALVSKGSDPNHSRNTVNPVHSSLMINSPEEALTHDPMHTVVPTSISPAISTTIISETSLSQFQENSGTPTFQQYEVKSDMNANHTQDEDNTKNGDNQEMDSTALVSKGADPNYSRNTVIPVHSSPMINSSEEALTHDPTPTVVPTSISPAISTTIISETSLFQFQEISGTPTFQQGELEGDCSNNSTQTFSQSITANFLDMAKIFKGVDSYESSTLSMRVKVGRYTIEQSLSTILESIIDRYGDIAQGCQLSDESASYVLELICKVYKNLQELSFNKLRSRHLKYLNTILTEARNANIDVDWLKNRHDELEEILRFESLRDATNKKIKAAESTKRTLGLKKAELVKAESEWESMKKQLTSLEAEYQRMEADLKNMVAEFKQYMEKPLSDGLL